VIQARSGEACSIGKWAVVAEGAVVPRRAVGPAGAIVAGFPARPLDRMGDDEHRAMWRGFKEGYVDLCARYRQGLDAKRDSCPRPRLVCNGTTWAGPASMRDARRANMTADGDEQP
jgi:hypothetical protein